MIFAYISCEFQAFLHSTKNELFFILMILIYGNSSKTSANTYWQKNFRIREIREMKQDHLAMELGMSQQAISRIEQSEEVDETILDKIAGVLGISVEGLKGFSEEGIVNYFNTFNHQSGSGAFFSSNNLCIAHLTL
ncbi:helix-turn-helix domain-containing protein [Pedobacter alpinus]|uniref:Helix-turn-helix domain-containing protein n=1 Tax=Pedobacter alpinus TaxID=1590643 RepID=A0ABW5TS09_9SPHI